MSLIFVANEQQMWSKSCGCPQPAIYWSNDFEARVCQNCGTVIMEKPGKEVKIEFVHLVVHTHLSFLKATCNVEGLIEKAKECGMTALAKTELGNLCGAPSFVKECKEAGIKPILGTTFNTKIGAIFHPITIIALNHVGYKNLVHLNTLAWQVRFGKDHGPTISVDDITNSDGLVAIIGVEQSGLGFESLVTTLATKIQPTLAATWHNQQDNDNLAVLRTVADKLHLSVVAVNNVRYINQSDHDAYRIALKIGHHDYLLQDPEYYFKSPNEMSELPFDDEWYRNTVRIADSVQDYQIINKEFIVPTFKDQNGEWGIEESFGKLQIEAWNGLAVKGLIDRPEYVKRLEYELDVIKRKKFASYFLIIAEIVDYIKSRGWLRPFGRGSSVGALTCYCLDITAMDPIRWNVPFERFINEGRIDLPDIDTDITQEGRGDVLKHIAEVHGRDRVAQIATFQTMGLKSSIDNVGRALDVAFVQNRELRNKISEDVEDIDDLSADVKKELDTVKGWADYARSLSGVTKHFGVHAAGIAIANNPIGDLVPLLPEIDGVLGVQYDMKDLEILGLLKLDMLGLRNLDVIQNTLTTIKRIRGVDIDVHNLSSDDKQTYDIVSTGDYVSVFQLDSPGYRKLARQLKPDKFEHIMALNALFRPGPLGSGVTDNYVKRRHDMEPALSWHPWLDNVLKPTYNTVLYQEQAMAMAQIIAGFDGVEADEFRKGIGKKSVEVVEKMLGKFKEGALKREGLIPPPGWSGSLESWIDDLIKKLHQYARYMWCSGHANGYGMITYVTAYLETHYPAEYYVSLLDSTDKSDKITTLMRGIMHKNYAVVPPDVNESGVGYSTTNGVIYMGLGAVRNVGNSAQEIVGERDNGGKFGSFIEFCQRLPSVNKTIKVNLIKSGAFKWDQSLCDRDKLDNIDVIQKAVRRKNKKYDGAKVAPIEIATECYITGADFTDIQRQQNERETLNSFITGHPAAVYQRLAPYLERKDAHVVCPSMLKDCQVGETILLVGMVDTIKKKFIVKEGRNHGNPYLVVHISDERDATMTNIWSPMCQDMERILVPGQVGMFECVTKIDRFREGKMSLSVKHAVMLTHGLPIQGIFVDNGCSPEAVLDKIGGMVQQTINVGARQYTSIRGRITVNPDILEGAAREFSGIKFMVCMETLDG